MQVKIFAGKPENVERAINRWADDGVDRHLHSMVSLDSPGEGEIGVMFVFTPVAAASASKIAVPNGALVH